MQVSERVLVTDAPVIVKTKRLIAHAGREDVLSLAQGIVHWQPPPQALQVISGRIPSPPVLLAPKAD